MVNPLRHLLDAHSLASSSTSALDVIEVLLRQVRENSSLIRSLYHEVGGKALVGKLQDLFYSAISSDKLEPSDVQGLCATLTSVADSHARTESTDFYVIWAAARAMDQYFHSRWIDCFTTRIDKGSTLVVRSGQVFPIVRSRVHTKAELFGGINSNPDNLTFDPTRLSGVGLLHGEGSVEFDFTLRDLEIGSLFRDVVPVCATGLLNCRQELKYECLSDGNGQYYCYQVAPKKADTCNSAECLTQAWQDWRDVQFERVTKLIETANREGVEVLVLPELCVDDQLQQRVIYYLQSHPCPAVVVAGSAHLYSNQAGTAKQSNRLQLTVRQQVFEYFKFCPLERYEGSYQDQPVQMDELLSPIQMHFRVLVAEQWSIMPLICKDFLHDAASAVIGQVRPAQVLVPALSLKSDPFAGRGASVTTNAQTILVVADNGIDNVHLEVAQNRPIKKAPSDQTNQGSKPAGKEMPEELKEPDPKRFATFGFPAARFKDALVHEQPFDQLPRLPVLFVLDWMTPKTNRKGRDAAKLNRRRAARAGPSVRTVFPTA